MPTTLTDADIDRHDAAGAGAPQTLSDADIDAHDRGTPPEPSGYGHELFRQLISDPVKALRENPFGALSSALGSAFSVINPGFDPVPGKGGQITLTQPTQGQAIQDIVNRGPGAVGAAATIGGLGLAAPLLGKVPVVGRIPTAVGEGVKAAAPGLTKAAGNIALGTALGEMVPDLPGHAGAALRTVLAARPVWRGMGQAGTALSQGYKAGKAALFPPATAQLTPAMRAFLVAAKNAPAPESVLPESVTADLTRPSEVAPPPIASQPPAEATAQLNAQAAKPAPMPVATRMANANRAVRAGSADTLAQGLQDTGISADMADTIPRFKWRDIARAHGVDWPASSEAQFNLIRDARAALRQRTMK